MVEIKLAYDPKEKFNWRTISKDSPEYNQKEINGKLVITIHYRLWEKVKRIIWLKKKGYDSPIIIDGKRRTGKSTLGKVILYLIDPNISIKNFVAGVEDSLEAVESASDDSGLLFDESSLNFASKDSMKKAQNQLLKIIDVCGQKRLTLIFILPTFFELNRTIAITHSLFLLHVYTDEKLNRGRFGYFGTKAKKKLYILGKKNFGSYAQPEADWTGTFRNFELPFEDEYLKLKKESLRQAINPQKKEYKNKQLVDKTRTECMLTFKENCPEVTDKILAKGFGISTREFYRRRKLYRDKKGECGNNIL